MRFYQLIQDTVRFEELKPLISSIFIHDKLNASQFVNSSLFLKNVYIFESQQDTRHENHFFQYPSSLCIALKGKAEFYFKELLIGQLDEINQPKILNLQDYMTNQSFKIVCEPKTELLFLGLGQSGDTNKKNNNEDTLRFTNFIQKELHRNIGLHFKSPIDSISVQLDQLENKFEKNQTISGAECSDTVSKIRNQLEVLGSYVKKSIVKSEVSQGGIESLRLINSDPKAILQDFFQGMAWDANLKVSYTEENIKVFIDSFKFKSALDEIVSFFLQNKPNQYRHQWVINYIKSRQQIEILFYFSYAPGQPPEIFNHNDQGINDISVQDNLPLLNEIVLSHKGNTQICEKNETTQIRIIIPQNLWRVQIKPLNIFIIDPDVKEHEALINSLSDKFIDANIVNYKMIDNAIEGFYQYQPEVIFQNIDSDYEGMEGEKILKKLHELFKDSGTDECLFIPISGKYTWGQIEAMYPNLSFNLLKSPYTSEELENTIRSLYSFINRYRVLRHNYKDVKMSAERDSVTGLYNRWYFDEYVSSLLQQSMDSKSNFSLIIADIDNFKIYNDTNGHQLGDKALQKFARVLSGSVRLSDTVARYGGEEFVIVLPHTSKENVLKIAEKIRSNVEEEIFDNEIAQPLKKVTASFGVSCYPNDGSDVTKVLRVADDNLYVAKDKGRNLVVG